MPILEECVGRDHCRAMRWQCKLSQLRPIGNTHGISESQDERTPGVIPHPEALPALPERITVQNVISKKTYGLPDLMQLTQQRGEVLRRRSKEKCRTSEVSGVMLRQPFHPARGTTLSNSSKRAEPPATGEVL